MSFESRSWQLRALFSSAHRCALRAATSRCSASVLSFAWRPPTSSESSLSRSAWIDRSCSSACAAAASACAAASAAAADDSSAARSALSAAEAADARRLLAASICRLSEAISSRRPARSEPSPEICSRSPASVASESAAAARACDRESDMAASADATTLARLARSLATAAFRCVSSAIRSSSSRFDPCSVLTLAPSWAPSWAALARAFSSSAVAPASLARTFFSSALASASLAWARFSSALASASLAWARFSSALASASLALASFSFALTTAFWAHTVRSSLAMSSCFVLATARFALVSARTSWSASNLFMTASH